MSKFWTYTTFWDKVTKSLAVFGFPSGALAAYMEANPFWLAISAVSGVAIALIAIWMVDKNNDGIVDLFQKKK